MRVIHDEGPAAALLMIAAKAQFGITGCNVRGCSESIITTILQTDEWDAGICQKHYEEAHRKGRWEFTLDFPSHPHQPCE